MSQSEVRGLRLGGRAGRGASVPRDRPARDLSTRDLPTRARDPSRGGGRAGAASGARVVEGEPGGDAEASPGPRGPFALVVGASGSPHTRGCVTAPVTRTTTPHPGTGAWRPCRGTVLCAAQGQVSDLCGSSLVFLPRGWVARLQPAGARSSPSPSRKPLTGPAVSFPAPAWKDTAPGPAGAERG